MVCELDDCSEAVLITYLAVLRQRMNQVMSWDLEDRGDGSNEKRSGLERVEDEGKEEIGEKDHEPAAFLLGHAWIV